MWKRNWNENGNKNCTNISSHTGNENGTNTAYLLWLSPRFSRNRMGKEYECNRCDRCFTSCQFSQETLKSAGRRARARLKARGGRAPASAEARPVGTLLQACPGPADCSFADTRLRRPRLGGRARKHVSARLPSSGPEHNQLDDVFCFLERNNPGRGHSPLKNQKKRRGHGVRRRVSARLPSSGPEHHQLGDALRSVVIFSCFYSAHAVPVQCPYSALTVPIRRLPQCPCTSQIRRGGQEGALFISLKYKGTVVISIWALYGHCKGTVRALYGHCKNTRK